MRAEHPSYRSSAAAMMAAILIGATAALAATSASNGLIGRPAPDFVLPAVAGSNVRLSEFRGQPVMISFWSSRCGLCAAQLTAMDRYYGTYRSSGLIVLGVSVEDDQQRAIDYAHAHAASFPLLLDKDKSVGRAFGIERLPTTVLIDRAGQVRFMHSDDRAGDPSYVAQIRALLDDRPERSDR